MAKPTRRHRVANAAIAAVVVAGVHAGLVWWLWMHFNPYVPESLGVRATMALTAVIGPAFFFALNLGFLVVFALNAAYLTMIFWMAGGWWRRRAVQDLHTARPNDR
jgi:hypothetical protein